MAYTQHRPHGAIAGRRFGSFSGKTAYTGGAHPVTKITQHRPDAAIAGRRYGSFAGKSGAPVPDPVYPFDHGVPAAWFADPGHVSAYSWAHFGIQVANRDNVAPSASTGAVLYIRPRFSATEVPGRATGAVLYVRPRFAASTNSTSGSTGAVVYFRPRLNVSTVVTGRTTGAVTYYPIRSLSGIWTTSTIPKSNLDNLRSLLPPQRNKAVNTDLTYAADLYRFLDYLVNVYLGGPDAPTITDIVASLEDTIQRATTAAVQAALAQQQSQANAEALAATIQVVQNNSLTGADQIPPAQTTMEA